MPICKKCSNRFPNTMRIDGKTKNLSKRKYCLECSPFDRHNTRKLENVLENGDYICSTCGRQTIHDRSKGNKGNVCGSCYSIQRRKQKKQFLLDQLGGRCMVCGYSKCNGSLAFHHLDETKKEFNISQGNRSVSTLLKEIEKCILVCHNCHGEIHAGMTSIPLA